MTKLLDYLISGRKVDGSKNFLDRKANIEKLNAIQEHTIFFLSSR